MVRENCLCKELSFHVVSRNNWAVNKTEKIEKKNFSVDIYLVVKSVGRWMSSHWNCFKKWIDWEIIENCNNKEEKKHENCEHFIFFHSFQRKTELNPHVVSVVGRLKGCLRVDSDLFIIKWVSKSLTTSLIHPSDLIKKKHSITTAYCVR